MGAVIDFPETMQRQWRVFETDLLGVMQQIGLPPDEVAHLLATLKPIYLRWARPGVFSGSGDEVVSQLNTLVHSLTSGLLLEIMTREVNLYRLGAPTR